MAGNRYWQQDTDGEVTFTEAGKDYLRDAVTNLEGDVYSFAANFSPTIVAAAMARLSRFGGDLRELLLKEFAEQAGQEEALLRRILTQFGDDSVQQLGVVPVVIENASNLVAKQVEWGRLAAYLEQSTRYIYYDVKRRGQYRYCTPDNLPEKLKTTYRKAMDTVFDAYSQLVHQMTEYYQGIDTTPEAERDTPWRIAIRGKACDAARGLLPLATTSTIGVVASGQAIDNMIMHLMSQDLPEAQTLGRQILEEVRKTHAIFFERTDMPKRGQATIAYRQRTRQRLAQLAARLTLAQPASETSATTVELLSYTPQDELELLAHMLFPYVSVDFAALRTLIAGWDNAQRQAVFALYMGERDNRRHKPGRALEVAHYTFELVSEYAVFKDLQRHRLVDALEWQSVSPTLGYAVPQSVVDAGYAESYKQAVQVANDLYDALHKAGFALEAQYATLHAHRLRWKITMNAREAFHFIELRTQPAGYSGYRQLCKQMHDEIARVHPLLAEAMIFVNRTDDDPSVSRLEQNRRADAKLRALGLGGLIE